MGAYTVTGATEAFGDSPDQTEADAIRNRNRQQQTKDSKPKENER